MDDRDLVDREALPRILRELMIDGLFIYYRKELPQLATDARKRPKYPCTY